MPRTPEEIAIRTKRNNAQLRRAAIWLGIRVGLGAVVQGVLFMVNTVTTIDTRPVNLASVLVDGFLVGTLLMFFWKHEGKDKPAKEVSENDNG